MSRLRFAELRFPVPHYHCAWTRLAAGAQTCEHNHDFPECFLVTKGKGTHWVNGLEQDLFPGACVWIEAEDRHAFSAVGNQGLEFLNLAIESTWWEGFRLLFDPCLCPGKQRSLPQEPRIWPLKPAPFAAVQEALAGLAVPRYRATWSLVGALLRLFEAVECTQGPLNEPVPEWLEVFYGMLQNPAYLARPLSWWQAKAGCSKEHLARCFRRFFGKTLTETLNEARLRRVQEGLLRGNDTVASLALEAGFEHVGHFHLLFKAKTGLSPLRWRKRQTQATVPR